MVVGTALLAGLAPGRAAEATAGLGPMPKWISSSQLKTRFEAYSLPELRALAEGGDPGGSALPWLALQRGRRRGAGYQSRCIFVLKAAEKGLALAQNNLAVLYTKGEGVPKDLNEAVRWYRRAADQGLPLALKNLGALSASGNAPELKAEEARLFYEQAAERGDAGAAVALGHSHLHPFPGASGDSESAVYWFTFAASKGCMEAYSNIGWRVHGWPERATGLR